MTSDNFVRIQTKPEKDKADSGPSLLSLVGDFGSAAANEAVQAPVNGVSQLVDHIAGGEVLGQMHTFDLQPGHTGSEQTAQQLGASIGMISPLLLSMTGVRLAKSGLGLAESRSLLGISAEAGAAGFGMGFVFTPTDNNANFWSSRLKSGVVDAGTFAVLGGTTEALRNRFPTALPGGQEQSLTARIAQSAMRRGAAGLPAGFVNAELNAAVDGRSATKEEIARDMAGFAALGVVMSPLDLIRPGEIAKPSTRSESEIKFPTYTPEQLAAGRANAMEFMRQHRAFSDNGDDLSLYEKFKAAGLTDTQQKRVLNSLAQIYENYASYRNADGTIDLDQKGNWFHTLDEMDEALTSSFRAGLTPAQTERSLMAMFGDADKTKSNFMVHHLDGARAAGVVLGRQTDANFTAEHIRWVEEANKEHQIGPPGLMAQIYTGAIRGQLNAERAAEFGRLKSREAELSPSDRQRLATLSAIQEINKRVNSADGPFIMPEESAAIKGIAAKISDPFNAPLMRTASGGMTAEFTALEKELLARTGNEHWYVPDPSTPWYTESRIGIDADSKANYTRVGGFKKLLGLNGPETDVWFQFKTLEDCLKSPLRSFQQAYQIMTRDAQQQSQSRLDNTQAAIDRARGRTETWVRQQIRTRDWLQQPGKTEDQILAELPFWKTELKYPQRDSTTDHEWWRVHKISPADRSPDEQQFYQAHRHDGLSPLEVKQFELAKEIREQMVNQMGAEQRLDGLLPRDLPPVMARDLPS